MNDNHITIHPDYNNNPYNHRTFTVNFFSFPIITTVTSKPSVVRGWLHKILHIHRHRRHRLVVGLGVQWRPSTSPQPATLQLCIGRHCLIFQLLYTNSIPNSLHRFLTNPRHTFVGVWNKRDRSMLFWSSDHSIFVKKLIDIRDVAAVRRGLSTRLSTQAYVEILLGFYGVEKPKPIGMSNWNAFWLSEDQVQYACVDAYVSFKLGMALNVWNWRRTHDHP